MPERMGANQGGAEPRLFVSGAGGLNDPAASVPQRDNNEARSRREQRAKTRNAAKAPEGRKARRRFCGVGAA